MKKYILDEQSLNAILDYLANRPYREVCDGINGLKNLPELVEAETSPTKEPEAVTSQG